MAHTVTADAGMEVQHRMESKDVVSESCHTFHLLVRSREYCLFKNIMQLYSYSLFCVSAPLQGIP